MTIVTFNEKNMPDFIKVTDVDFQIIGDVSILETDVPKRIGNFDAGIKRGGKRVTLTCKLVKREKSIHEYADILKAWAKGDDWKPSKLIFNDQPEFHMMARVVNSLDVTDLFAVGETEIEFYAADPIKYKNEADTVHSVDGEAIISYEGIEDSPLILSTTLSGGASKITLHNDRTDRRETLILEGEVLSGSILEIDCNKKVIKIDDKARMNLLTLSSEWIYLKEGFNVLTLIVDNRLQDFTATIQTRN